MHSLNVDVKMEALMPRLAMSIVLFTLGYQAHSYFNGPTKSTRRSISSCSKSHTIAFSTGSRPGSGSGSDTADASDTESDAEDEAAALTSDIASVRAKAMEEVKMVLVVNDSLKMSKGKIAAQAGHATLACAMMLKEVNPRLFSKWRNQGQPKIALRCADNAELDTLAAQARSLNLCARTIQDAGRTQVAPGSKTILGIGPGPAKLINQVTGKLRLL